MRTYPAREVLELRRTGAGSYEAHNVPDSERAVVFGGQLIGQTLIAAQAEQPAKSIRQVHTVFSRAGRISEALNLEVTELHAGRTLGSSYVLVEQGGRTICASLVLHDSPEGDVLRSTTQPPDVPGPDELTSDTSQRTDGAEVRVVGAVDVDSLSASGPAELNTWVRWTDAGPALQPVDQALVAWFTDPFLIPAAMRPHPGLSLSMSHVSLSTGVLTHTLTFHEPVDATQWLLIHQRAVHAGAGRVYGEGHVFTTDGTLIASFAQEAMIRRAGEVAASPATML